MTPNSRALKLSWSPPRAPPTSHPSTSSRAARWTST